MTALTANLKLYGQNKGLIVGYAFIISCMFLLFWVVYHGESKGIGILAATTLVMLFFAAYIIGIIQSTISSKPFAIVLPGNNKIQRKVVFILGAVIALLSAFLYTVYSTLAIGPVSSLSIAAWAAAALSLYLLVVGLIFRFMPKGNNPSEFACSLLLFFLSCSIPGAVFFFIFSHLVRIYPLIVIIFTGFLSSVCWKILLKKPLVSTHQTRREQKQSQADPGLLERFFLAMISGNTSLEWKTIICGSIYSKIASISKYFWILSVFLIALWLIPAGFSRMHILFLVSIIFFIPAATNPIGSSLLLAMGRFERLVSCVVTALVELAIVLIMISFTFLLSHQLDGSMPGYHAPHFRMLYLVVILIPVTQLNNLLLARKHLILVSIKTCIFVPCLFFYVFSLKMPLLSHAVGISLASLAHLILWSFMAYECLNSDLIVVQENPFAHRQS
jgi:hypothetical protein